MLRIKWIGIYCGSSGSAPSNNTSSAAAPTKAEEPTSTPEASTAMTATTATTTTEEMTATATMTTAETAPATTSAMTSTETMTTTPAMTATESMTTSGAMTGTNEEAGMVVNVAEDPKLGKILVDAKGMTLYLFDKDTAGKSNCSGNCIKNWPALTVKDEAEKLTAGEGVTAKLEVIDRGDGTYQVTANGMPLYYYAKDANVGDTTGQGVGDVWWVLAPDGAKVSTK